MTDQPTNDVIGDERKAILRPIYEECKAHNDFIGAEEREDERVWSDASFINMVRHKGIAVETLAMMTTDFRFAVASLRAENERRKEAQTKLHAMLDASGVRGGSGLGRVGDLIQERDALRKIVDALPKTADGVPFYPGMTLYFPVEGDAPVSTGVSWFNAVGTYGEGEDVDSEMIRTELFYSTQEAADKAALQRIVNEQPAGSDPFGLEDSSHG